MIRRLILVAVCIAALAAVLPLPGQSPSPSPDPGASPSPSPDVYWIGRGDVPWILVDGQEIDSIDLTSQEVVSILRTLNVHLRQTSAGHGQVNQAGAIPPTLAQIRAAYPKLRRLPISRQADIAKATVAAWVQFYALVGTEGTGNGNYFDQQRKLLLARFKKEGLTEDVLQACEAFHAQLVAETTAASPTPSVTPTPAPTP